MAFTAQDVKKLREMTNVGMMDCKKALQATDGDMDKAVDWLREKGLSKAIKKSSICLRQWRPREILEHKQYHKPRRFQ